MPIKINGSTSGSTTITAPATGTDETIELSTALAAKLPIAGGKVLQIVRSTDATIRSTSSTTFVDVTGMSVTITPQKSTSSIIVIALFNGEAGIAGNTQEANYQITNASNVALSGAEGARAGFVNLTSAGTSYLEAVVCMFGYSSPATTSATTYKLRFKMSVAGTNAVNYIRNDVTTGQMYALEVSA